MADKKMRSPSELHSVRTKSELWGKARRRADSDGVTMNYVVSELLEGYARGLINLPRITKQYSAVVSTDQQQQQ